MHSTYLKTTFSGLPRKASLQFIFRGIELELCEQIAIVRPHCKAFKARNGSFNLLLISSPQRQHLAGHEQGGEQERDDAGHVDGPHKADVPSQPNPGASVTPDWFYHQEIES